ncbi:MAG: glycosyltransferase family 4 protein [Candidatus Promineifilaceae bacterium]|jgi:glycosyltransferase involved in cell wall biosynthesis
MHKPSIAIVVQRYGSEVNGGAEFFARLLAEHLTEIADVRVLTTCAIDYHTWANEYAPGSTTLNGVRIERFPVDYERASDGVERTAYILQKEHTLFDEYDWVRAQGPFSSKLLEAIRGAYADTDLFIFVTYLYAHTVFGLPLVSDKALLIPHAHDEPFLKLGIMRQVFHAPQAIIYNVEPEMRMVQSAMQNNYIPQFLAGVGIDTPADVNPDRFRASYDIDGDFILYVGRVDENKNVHKLLDYFARYRDSHETDLKLILIGKAHMPIPDRPDIISLGFVSEEDKFDALAASVALVQPSQYESLSLVALESWLVETPVLVNGQSEVLKYQCRQSNGGLYYGNYDEFELALTRILGDPQLAATMGRQGRAFVEERFSWDIILAKFQALFETLTVK